MSEEGRSGCDCRGGVVASDTSMRITEHPILGQRTEVDLVTITVDGATLRAHAGEPIAAALAAAGLRIHRYTDLHAHPRGIFCAIGQCTDCAMTVDGVSGVRTCITPVRQGMEICTSRGGRGTAHDAQS